MINWQDVQVQGDITYEERSMLVLDKKEQVLRNKAISLVKVLWQHHGQEEATWELESSIRESYPELFADGGMINFEDEISFKEGRT